MRCSKNWQKDLLFIFYVLIIMPLISIIYFGYALTNFDFYVSLAGGIALWLILIPYPVYWYIKNRIFI